LVRIPYYSQKYHNLTATLQSFIILMKNRVNNLLIAMKLIKKESNRQGTL